MVKSAQVAVFVYAAALFATDAAAQGTARGAGVTAVRTASPPKIDGRLDDAQWRAAPPFTAFVQSYPNEGHAPSEPTELRVLYDDVHLYFAVRCLDSQPTTITRTLGRRDSPPASDAVRISIDSANDGRTAYAFSITAGGVKQDGIFSSDVQFTPEWDEVWDADVSLMPDGWSAELAVPLRLLRFPPAALQTWNVHVHRALPRTHEQIDSALIPRTANRFVSLFNPLHGLVNLEPRRSVQLLPYAAARLAIAPRHDDDARPTPRLLNPSGDLGVDVTAQLSSSFSLVATLNPDFGQVEADQVVLNLGTSESFFPEKRPFFTQGLDLFAPVGSQIGNTPHRIFYSRRIGLQTPILAAAKLTGATESGLELGVLDAVVAGAARPVADEVPDRRIGFYPLRPLHLGLNNELPKDRPVTRNYFALVARKRVLNDASRASLRFTDVTPLSKACYREDFPTDAAFEAADCEPAGQRVAGLDFDVRTADRRYGVWGQVAGSQLHGRAKPATLRDGTVLKPGDFGFATYMRAGKLGGEPFRAALQYELATARFDVNQAGFVATQNVQSLRAEAQYLRSEPLGFVRDLSAVLFFGQSLSADGRLLRRGSFVGMNARALFPRFTFAFAECGVGTGGFDLREIPRENIGYERSPDTWCAVGVGTDQTKQLFANLHGFGFRNLPRGEVLHRRGGYGGDLRLTFRPTPVLQTQLGAHYEAPSQTARFVERDGEDLLFAGLVAPYTSLTLRQQWVMTPELTLQAYAQLFAASGHHAPYYVASYPGRGGLVTMDDLRLAEVDRSAEHDFRHSALNLNVVLRWEYRLGSTLYAVYTRSQRSLPAPGTSAGLTLGGLGRGPATDTFLVKWAYYFSVN